jgi:hypothetical protein
MAGSVQFFLQLKTNWGLGHHVDFLALGPVRLIFLAWQLSFSCWCNRSTKGKEKETVLAVPKRWQIQSIWILGVQEFVLFVLGAMLCLLPKIQFASVGIFNSFGPSEYWSMSYPFWVICSCASRLHFDDHLCLKLVVLTTGVAPMASQASREGGVVWQAGKTWRRRVVILQIWRYMLEKTLRRWGQRLSKKGRMMRILTRQDDLRYVIIKSKVVSLICICSCYFLGWSCCGPIRVLFYILGLGLSKPNSFLAVYIRRLDG